MSGRVTALAVVATQQPIGLLHQLCRAWGGRCESQFDRDHGYVEFGFGRCEMRADRHRLTLTATAWEREDCERIRALIGRQLERAGRREQLNVLWR
jgi:hypothetical protein